MLNAILVQYMVRKVKYDVLLLHWVRTRNSKHTIIYAHICDAVCLTSLNASGPPSRQPGHPGGRRLNGDDDDEGDKDDDDDEEEEAQEQRRMMMITARKMANALTMLPMAMAVMMTTMTDRRRRRKGMASHATLRVFISSSSCRPPGGCPGRTWSINRGPLGYYSAVLGLFWAVLKLSTGSRGKVSWPLGVAEEPCQANAGPSGGPPEHLGPFCAPRWGNIGSFLGRLEPTNARNGEDATSSPKRIGNQCF